MKETKYPNNNVEPSVIRSMIQHENTLMNHRMTWMLVFQGFLFTSLGLSWSQTALLHILVSVIGGLSCLSFGYSLHCARCAIEKLEQSAKEFGHPFPIGWGIKEARFQFLLPWILLPRAIGIVWVIICVHVAFGFSITI